MRQGRGKDERKASQGYVDLKKLTPEQLDELIERQSKLLQNRSFLEKLPDKGSKISLFKTELENERKKREEECDKACQLMLNLSLNDKNADELEWKEGSQINSDKRQLNTDDDDLEKEEDRENVNPLKLVATHCGTANGISPMKNHTKDETDIKKSLYIDKFCEKFGRSNNSEERFKPNQFKNKDKTLFVTSAEQVKKRLGDKWEVTEATPPVPIYKNVMMISLSESLALQQEQAKKLKEIEQKHAKERLLQSMSLKMGDTLCVKNMTEYRDTRNSFEGSVEDEENESADSDSEDTKNTVCFFQEEDR